MDELQRQPEVGQPDPQLVATVTASVLQTLQAAGTIPAMGQKAPNQPEPKTIDLIGLFFALLEKFWLVVLFAIAGAVFMGVTSSESLTTYTATSKLYIVDTSSGSINFANLQLGTALTNDYQEVFKTWEVPQMVIEELNLPFSPQALQGMVTVTNPEDTRILYITARYHDAKMAADIANAYAQAAKKFIIETMRGEEPSDFSIALEPSAGYRVSKYSRVVLGFMGGSVLAVGLITLFFVLDNRPRSPETIEQYGKIPTLAVFPDRTRKMRDYKQPESKAETIPGMPMLEISQFPECDFVSHEAMNTLCTNLSYCGTDMRKVMLTSRYAGEGKSYVSMNLMRSLARLGRRVVLVDTDLRASGIQADYRLRYSTEKHYGLSEYLSGHCSMAEALYQTDIPGAFMIPAGHEAPNPLQLLDTEKMRQLVEWLGTQFDMVLIDTPPVGVLVDAVAMAKFCDGALLVVGYRKGNQNEIASVVKQIKQTGCKMLGAALNGVHFRTLSNKYYYYSSERYAGHYSRRYQYGKRSS